MTNNKMSNVLTERYNLFVLYTKNDSFINVSFREIEERIRYLLLSHTVMNKYIFIVEWRPITPEVVKVY